MMSASSEIATIEILLAGQTQLKPNPNITFWTEPDRLLRFCVYFLNFDNLPIPLVNVSKYGPLYVEGCPPDRIVNIKPPNEHEQYVLDFRIRIPSDLYHFPVACILRLQDVTRVIPVYLKPTPPLPEFSSFSHIQQQQQNSVRASLLQTVPSPRHDQHHFQNPPSPHFVQHHPPPPPPVPPPPPPHHHHRETNNNDDNDNEDEEEEEQRRPKLSAYMKKKKRLAAESDQKTAVIKKKPKKSAVERKGEDKNRYTCNLCKYTPKKDHVCPICKECRGFFKDPLHIRCQYCTKCLVGKKIPDPSCPSHERCTRCSKCILNGIENHYCKKKK